MARPRAEAAAAAITLLDGSAETIPLDSGSIDTVITTWTLCTIPNVGQALSEMRRVLRPGGALLFVEHGRAPEPSVARWQMDDLINGNGFRIETLENARLPGPRTHTFLYQGRAKPA